MPTAFEARRYSAILLSSEDIHAPDAVLEVLGAHVRSVRPVSVESSRWDFKVGTVRVEAKYSRASDPSEAPDGKYDHPVYAGSGLIAGRRCVVVISPFLRLLEDSLVRLESRNELGLVFFKPSMSALFAYFEVGKPKNLTATRISVLMDGDVGVEVVSLSGRNPLRSDLRSALLDSAEGTPLASPYGLRIKGTYVESRASNVHLDRHGNLWFYLGREDALTNFAAVLSTLSDYGDMMTTTSSPLRRLFDEDSSQ